jgi:hypothetical protein
MSSFHANCVVLEDTEDFWLVGFADQENDTEEYLMLQRSFADDEQDKTLGMATYYVERNDQALSCYGGIDSCNLYTTEIIFSFDEKGAERLNISEPLRITFGVDPGRLTKLRARLASVFSGTNCLHDHAA